jgi:hypothetical protein
MLTFSCDTCTAKFEADISNNDVTYLSGNERVTLKGADDPCRNCLKEIALAEEEAKAKIKERNTTKQDNLF